MDLRNKRVIVIGERDGVNGAAIEACLRGIGTEILYVETQCFV